MACQLHCHYAANLGSWSLLGPAMVLMRCLAVVHCAAHCVVGNNSSSTSRGCLLGWVLENVLQLITGSTPLPGCCMCHSLKLDTQWLSS